MTPEALPDPAAQEPAEEIGTNVPMLLQVPIPMRVSIPMPGISLRGLHGLRVGDVISSQWQASGELPIYAADVALSWGEFEVVGSAIAIRLTRLD